MAQKNRLLWIDILNIVACFGVLLLHCTNREIHHYSGEESFNLYLGLFTHSFFIWPVTVFYMLSGYTNIRAGEFDTKKFYFRRLNRIFVPFFAWYLFYSIKYVVTIKGFDISIEFFRNFFRLKYNGYLWFFIPLFSIYISIPFLRQIVFTASRAQLKLFAVASIILLSIVPMFFHILDIEDYNNLFPMGSAFIYAAFLGYYIGNYEFSNKSLKLIYANGIVQTIIIIVGTYYLITKESCHYDYLLTYSHFPVLSVSVAVFCYFRYLQDKLIYLNSFGLGGVISKIASLSFGIYLIQSLVLQFLSKFEYIHSFMLLKFCIAYPLCAFLVLGLKHIPLVKRLVP